MIGVWIMPKIDERKWHCIHQIQRCLLSLIFGALARLNAKLFIIFGIIFCWMIFPLQAKLQDHLQKCPDKEGHHSIQNIDFIYLINLDERPQKWNRSLSQLLLYGISPYRFSAVNGWKLSLEAINDLGLRFSSNMIGGFMGTTYHLNGDFAPSHEMIQNEGQSYFCHCLSRGAIGIVLSHLSILRDALDSGYETIWVMEDDVEILDNPHCLSELVKKLDDCVGRENWDVLFTDQDIRDSQGRHKPCYWAAKRPDFGWKGNLNDYAYRVDVSEDFRCIGARWGAHSMIIRKSGMQKLWNFFNTHQLFLPYDMDYILPIGIRLFNSRKDIVSNLPNAPSDNGGPNYLQK